MKVYVVLKGCYSDTHIIGVTFDKRIAEELKNRGERLSNEVHYEEWETDMFGSNADDMYFRFVVYHNYDDDSFDWKVEKDDYYEGIVGCDNIMKDFSERKFMQFNIRAKTAEQALKIAQDMKAEHLAKKKGLV